MKKILNEYIEFIRAFEKLLKVKYTTKKNPCTVAGTLFERIGMINGIEYRFHGTGCTVKMDGILYIYDISIFDNDEIQFSIWEIFEFVKSHPVYSKLNYSQDFIEKELEKLIGEGILDWLVIMGRIYKTYRVIKEDYIFY